MVKTTKTKQEVISEARTYFGEYSIVSKTDSVIIFEDGRDFNAMLMILAVLFLFLGAIIYYFMSQKHSIQLTFTESVDGLNVNCLTSTEKALKDSLQFLSTI